MSSPIIILYVIDHSPDNGRSTLEEDISAFLAKNNALIKFIYIQQENKGYAGGHNKAIQDAIRHGASYHLVVNPDVYFDKKVIPAIFNFMEENPDVGQLMPKVLYPTGELQRLCKLIPAPMDLLGRFLLPNFFLINRNERFELANTSYKKIMNVPYLSGCFMFFRLSTLQEIGLLDEHFFMYAEDIDITRRIHEKYRTVFFPKVYITHLFNRADRLNNKERKMKPSSFLYHFRLAAYRSFFISSSTSLRSSVGSKRLTAFPSRSIRNFVKFHLMSLFFSKSGSAFESISCRILPMGCS